jgi:hypothetical protein
MGSAARQRQLEASLRMLDRICQELEEQVKATQAASKRVKALVDKLKSREGA